MKICITLVSSMRGRVLNRRIFRNDIKLSQFFIFFFFYINLRQNQIIRESDSLNGSYVFFFQVHHTNK